MKFIIHNDSMKFAEIDLPVSLHSNDYGRIQEKFAKDFHRNAVDMLHVYPGDEAEGVSYIEELAGPIGMNFWLIKTQDITEAQIEAAKHRLKSDRDVVRIKVIKLKERVAFVLPEFGGAV